MFNRTEWSTKRAVHYNMGERKVLVKRRAKTLLIGMIAWFLLAAPVNAIQILENEQFVQGQRVKHTISIGITPAQIALGPIGGFFVNLFLFPFVGPSPEIISIEFDITNIEYTEDIEGTADISADGLEAIWEFDTMITEPMITDSTELTAYLEIQYDPSTPLGTVATYELSSLNISGGTIESLEFSSTYPVPEPTTILLLGLGGLALRRRRRAC